MNKVFIGFDPRQVLAYTVLQTSIITRADKPVTISPLIFQQLPLKRLGLTPFTWSRFLVPWLCDFHGWALFLDIDTYARDDIGGLFDLADEKHAVMVSKNKLAFEWASVMLFNCGHPDNRKLTPEFVETANKLHAISWTENIGELPGEWNHLVGYDEPNPNAKLVHFTQGVPCWPETFESEFAEEWHNEAKAAFSAQPWAALMGRSVHAKPVMERLAKQHGNGKSLPVEETPAGVAP